MSVKTEEWDDIEDFKEICTEASSSYLIGMCEYEIKSAKNAILEDDAKRHYEFADLAYKELEKRGVV